MTKTSVEDTSADATTTGCVKWFNNKAGYGFINVTSGENVGTDIFVHHTAIQVSKEQYKYLVQGEYVQFELNKADSGSHEWQAGNVRGLENGKLMCETRYDSRESRDTKSRQESSEHHSNSRTNRYRGRGPREGEEWLLVRRRVSSSNGSQRSYTNNRPPRHLDKE